MSQKIAFPVVTQDVTFLDSIATGHLVAAYCGPRTYTLMPIHAFLTISGTTMSLLTSLVTDASVYSVYITVALTNYPMVAPLTKSFVVTIICEVQTLIFSLAPAASTTL